MNLFFLSLFSIVPRKPKKLIKWLREILDNETYKHLGLEWEDRASQTFWLPWPRQKNKGWKEAVSVIFLAYVKMQGGYKDGEDKPYVQWKARFRTALNKDPCIREHKSRHQKGKKLYQMVNADQINIRKRNESGSSLSSSSDSSGSSSESTAPNSPNSQETCTGSIQYYLPIVQESPLCDNPSASDTEDLCEFLEASNLIPQIEPVAKWKYQIQDYDLNWAQLGENLQDGDLLDETALSAFSCTQIDIT